MKDGVRTDRAHDIVAFPLRLFHSRRNLLDFFPTEEPMLTRVRIESRDSHLALNAELLQCFCAAADILKHALFRNGVTGIAQ